MTRSGFDRAGAFRLDGPRHAVRADGVRASLAPGLAHGPGAAGAALAMLRREEIETGRPGIVVGAIGFDPYQPARLWVPVRHDVAAAAVRRRSEVPGTVPVPDDPHYRGAVEVVLDRIADGRLTKVVLARSVDVRTAGPVDTGALFDQLASANPAAYAFGVDTGDDGVLMGASPELLVSVDGRDVVSNPLAGSTPRHDDAAADDRAREELAASGKDLGEHRIVVDAVGAALAPLTSTLTTPAGPSVSATEQLWHLSTTLTGQLRPGVTALDAAYALHPTPAVAGMPSLAAARLIRDLEGADRRFFAGLVGWMDSAGNGEWVLALRCGLVRGDRVRVHAGAGVVAASTAAGEHAETGTKLQTFLRSLQAVAGDLDVEPVLESLAVSS